MYTHPSSFHVVGLVREKGSSDIKLSEVSADLSFFFINFLFSLLVFLFVFFSLDPAGAAKKKTITIQQTHIMHTYEHEYNKTQ